MITPDKIGWSHYQDYEGPFFHGSQGYVLPVGPDDADKQMAVVTATEGGHYDAINMYDRCIISVGIIQWCEAGQYSVSNMLGAVADNCGIDKVLVPLKPSLDAAGATFKKNAAGKWRFHFLDDRGEVNTLDEQRALFLGCSGLTSDTKTGWTDASRAKAKQWAADMANVWLDAGARKAQVGYTRALLLGFVMSDAKRALFDATPSTGWVAALRAAYVSFAANNPLHARDSLVKALAETKADRWSAAWCTTIIKHLTYDPAIAIYPKRYEAIRPVLETLWGVSLPKTAPALFAWQEPEPTVVATPVTARPSPAPEVPDPAPEGHTEPPVTDPKVEPPTLQKNGPEPTLPEPTGSPSGALASVLWFLQKLFAFLSRRPPAA